MMRRREWEQYLYELEEELDRAESRVNFLRQEIQDHKNEPIEAECAECGTPISPDNWDGICYQCQCELHAIGVFDMDGEGWNVR